LGVYGPLAISLMFFVQAILPLVPYAILAGVAGIIFGKWLGIFIAWIGALAGTLSIYLLARYTGTGFFQPWLKRKYSLNLKDMDLKTLFLLLLSVRIFPVLPTPLINIGSGLSGVPPAVFIASSALGMMPWAIAYVALGDYFNRSRNLGLSLAILGILLIIFLSGVYYLRKRVRFLEGHKVKSYYSTNATT
jgi:uncharacterized membrane protein YdjX (TVP38/TMEM64 family)